MKKIISSLILVLVFNLNGNSQIFSINDTLSMTVQRVTVRKSAPGIDGIVFAGKGKRFLELKINFYSSVNKRVKVKVWNVIFKINDEEQIAILDVDGPVTFEEGAHYFKFKKSKTRKIFANVSSEFTSGELYYDTRLIGTIKVNKGEKYGIFIPVN